MSSRAASLKYQSAGHQSLSALELSQSILNEVTLAGFILLIFFFLPTTWIPLHFFIISPA